MIHHSVSFPRKHLTLLLFILFTQTPRPVIAALAKRAAARSPAVSIRIIAPPDHLRKILDTVNLTFFNTARDDHLITFPVFSLRHQRCGGCCGHLPVSLIVVSDPDTFFIRNAEVDGDDSAPGVMALQFPQPLVGDVEVTCDGKGENSTREIAARPARACDAVAQDAGESRFPC